VIDGIGKRISLVILLALTGHCASALILCKSLVD